MIFEEMPKEFEPRFEVVSCFLRYGSEILLLHRPAHKSQGNRWGMPAGKVQNGENIKLAIVREIEEETGITVDERDIAFFKTVFVRHDIAKYDFVYHMFHATLPERRYVSIRPSEHKGYTWVTPEESLKMSLVEDLDECIKMFFGYD